MKNTIPMIIGNILIRALENALAYRFNFKH